ncbi:hypothetical protein BJX65DRAFT_312621 [Aspergillus insuetus]
MHVLSLGSISTFTAHGLKEISNARAVTLLLHRESLYDEFLRNSRQISLRTLAGTTASHGGYSAELYKDGNGRAPPPPQTDADGPRLAPSHRAPETLVHDPLPTERLRYAR